jgi:hypothetical protein
MFTLIFSVSVLDLSIAFVLLTVIHNQATAYTVSYTFILISVITTMALMDAGVLYKLFFNTDMPTWTLFVRWIFELLPSFHFTKLYSDMTQVTASHLSLELLLWIPGREWTLDDFFKDHEG